MAAATSRNEEFQSHRFAVRGVTGASRLAPPPVEFEPHYQPPRRPAVEPSFASNPEFLRQIPQFLLRHMVTDSAAADASEIRNGVHTFVDNSTVRPLVGKTEGCCPKPYDFGYDVARLVTIFSTSSIQSLDLVPELSSDTTLHFGVLLRAGGRSDRWVLLHATVRRDRTCVLELKDYHPDPATCRIDDEFRLKGVTRQVLLSWCEQQVNGNTELIRSCLRVPQLFEIHFRRFSVETISAVDAFLCISALVVVAILQFPFLLAAKTGRFGFSLVVVIAMFGVFAYLRSWFLSLSPVKFRRAMLSGVENACAKKRSSRTRKARECFACVAKTFEGIACAGTLGIGTISAVAGIGASFWVSFAHHPKWAFCSIGLLLGFAVCLWLKPRAVQDEKWIFLCLRLCLFVFVIFYVPLSLSVSRIHRWPWEWFRVIDRPIPPTVDFVQAIWEWLIHDWDESLWRYVFVIFGLYCWLGMISVLVGLNVVLPLQTCLKWNSQSGCTSVISFLLPMIFLPLSILLFRATWAGFVAFGHHCYLDTPQVAS